MRFTFAVVAGFAALASAATSVSVDPAQKSQIACLDKCDAGDVDCQSHCITVPSPDKTQVNNTINCVGNCKQGDGSKAATDAYSKCVQSCISDNYYKTSVGTPEQTGSSDSGNDSKDSSDSSDDSTATNSASGADATDASETESSSDSTATGTSTGTSTSSSSKSTSSGNAAAGMVVGSTGFLGLIAAVLAL
ncbi:hypothetical protein BGZ63DRAFT_375366 [Mariannaea sp. PMI_226]|nr:hypothetical protein BGZ63DRAFT_375366 [Mariannaea sp. PMI_226]